MIAAEPDGMRRLVIHVPMAVYNRLYRHIINQATNISAFGRDAITARLDTEEKVQAVEFLE